MCDVSVLEIFHVISPIKIYIKNSESYKLLSPNSHTFEQVIWYAETSNLVEHISTIYLRST
jgi:hypothetical protein